MSTSDIRARLQAGEAIDPPTLIALLDEIERLRRWKDEALAVLSEWEKTWVAAGVATAARQETYQLPDFAAQEVRRGD